MTTLSVVVGEYSMVCIEAELLARIGVDGEGRLLFGFHGADVSFVDVGLDLHAGKVFGQREEDGRL